jgi:hypothetical protein
MYAEGKLPEPEDVHGIGPFVVAGDDRALAEREWWETQRWRKRPS